LKVRQAFRVYRVLQALEARQAFKVYRGKRALKVRLVFKDLLVLQDLELQDYRDLREQLVLL
jgi:hypothetical protein